MYTGIAQAVARILDRTAGDGNTRFVLRLPVQLLADLRIGGSVSVDGVCLSAVAIDGQEVSFDVSDGTLAITNLGDRNIGSRVNVERSARSGDENGGHVVTGHVSGTARVTGINTGSGPLYLRVGIPEPHRKYVFVRGFLAINGASLTVAEVDASNGEIKVNLIPETVRQTSLSDYRAGDRINYEIELQTQIMVDTIERCIRQTLSSAA